VKDPFRFHTAHNVVPLLCHYLLLLFDGSRSSSVVHVDLLQEMENGLIHEAN